MVKRSDLLSGTSDQHLKAQIPAPFHAAGIKQLENSLSADPVLGSTFNQYQSILGTIQDVKRPWERFSNSEAAVFRRIARLMIGELQDAQWQAYAEGWNARAEMRDPAFSRAPECVDKLTTAIKKEISHLSEEQQFRMNGRISDFTRCTPEMRLKIIEADSPEKQDALVHFMGMRRREIKRETIKLSQQSAKIDAELADINRSRDHLFLIKEVLEFVNAPTAQEPAQDSSLYKLKDAYESGIILRGCKIADNDDFYALTKEGVQLITTDPEIFVVQHNWLDAFKTAGEFAEGEWRLPGEVCAFEFQFVGHRVVVYSVAEDGIARSLHLFARCRDNIWVEVGTIQPDEIAQGGNDALSKTVLGNIRAICIALDAEVAEKQVIRAPHLTNERRQSSGRSLLKDFHVVTLAHRSRASALEYSAGETKRRMRMHFRRGHWRHFPTHKTWIKWMLVGNPDLGFINKEYRL